MKYLYQVLPVILSVGLLGCGNSNNPTTQESAETTVAAPTESKDQFVSKLPDTAPVMKVAMTGDLPPFSFQDDYGNMQGTDVDSMRAIGEEQGFKVEFYKHPWQGLFDAVEAGERDLAVSGIAFTNERDSKYGLSNPYFFNPSAVAYMDNKYDDLSIKTLADLKGLRVGSLEDTRQDDTLKGLGDNIKRFPKTTSFLSFQSLLRDEVDIMVDDLHLLTYTVQNQPGHKITIVPYEGADSPSAQQVVLMAKGNTELIKTVNEGIDKLKAKGTFKEIEERWLGAKATPTETAAASTTAQAN